MSLTAKAHLRETSVAPILARKVCSVNRMQNLNTGKVSCPASGMLSYLTYIYDHLCVFIDMLHIYIYRQTPTHTSP